MNWRNHMSDQERAYDETLRERRNREALDEAGGLPGQGPTVPYRESKLAAVAADRDWRDTTLTEDEARESEIAAEKARAELRKILPELAR